MHHDARRRRLARFAYLCVLALAGSVAFGAASAAAAPTVTIDPTPVGNYNTITASGTIDPGANASYWSFQTSTDGVNWSGFNYEGLVDGGTGVQNIPPHDFGAAPGTEFFVRLAGLDTQTGEEVFSPGPNPKATTKPVPAPVVIFNQPSAVTATTATFSGSFDPEAPAGNPQAFDITWYIECTPECPGMPYEIIPADSAVHPFSVEAKDLIPGTEYEVRYVIQNAGGTYTHKKTFTTPALAPTVTTSRPTVTTTTANLTGSINPNGAETTYHFEWGPGFANKTPTKSLFAGSEALPVNFNLTGLTPDTAYPFRLVAENSIGEVNSTEKTFTTQAVVVESCANDAFRVGPSTALPDCRAYELVNPPGTDWSDIVRVLPADDNGEHIAYFTLVAPDIAQSAVIASAFKSDRTPSGWVTTDSNMRVKYVYTLGLSIPTCYSSDWSRAIIDSPASFTDQDSDGRNDLFRINVGDPEGEWLSFGEGYLPDQQGGIFQYLGGSPDLSSVIFHGFWNTIHPEAPGTGQGGQAIYLRDDDGLQIVSRDENGKVIEATPFGTSCSTRSVSGTASGTNSVSCDGTKVYFRGTDTYNPGPVYRADLETGKSVAVSKSRRAGSVGEIVSGGFQYASPDGELVYFTADVALTNDATQDGGLYRYDFSTDTLELLTPPIKQIGFGFGGSAFPAESDSRVYFTSTQRLTPEAPRNRTGIYVWERGDAGGTPGPGGPSKGTTRLITTLTDGGISRVSPNGDYMLFQSPNSIDGANNKNRTAIYLYSAATRDIACVSCRANGTPSGRESSLANEPESLTTGIINPRNITNDGRVFFNSSDKLIAADQTFSQDVYEYDDGRLRLLSTGQGDENPSYLLDNSDDGSHVFILSRSALRPEDRDAAELDIYDAHSGGGFALPRPTPPICEGEACRTTTSPKPEAVAPTTPNFSGAGDPLAKRKKPDKSKKKHKKKKQKKKNGKKKNGKKNGKNR